MQEKKLNLGELVKLDNEARKVLIKKFFWDHGYIYAKKHAEKFFLKLNDYNPIERGINRFLEAVDDKELVNWDDGQVMKKVTYYYDQEIIGLLRSKNLQHVLLLEDFLYNEYFYLAIGKVILRNIFGRRSRWDIFNDAFTNFIVSLKASILKFKGEATLKTYFQRILANEGNMYHRGKRKRDFWESLAGLEGPIINTIREKLDEINRIDLQQALSQLELRNKYCYDLLTLVSLGYNQVELAKEFFYTEGSFTQIIYKCRDNLRTIYNELTS